MMCFFFFFQAEDGIRDLVRSRGLGDVYKRQEKDLVLFVAHPAVLVGALLAFGDGEEQVVSTCAPHIEKVGALSRPYHFRIHILPICLLYTSDAADERSSVDLGGRRIIKKKEQKKKNKHTQKKKRCSEQGRDRRGFMTTRG